MRRKLLLFILSLTVILSFVACGQEMSDTEKNNIDWELEEEIDNTERKVYDHMDHEELSPNVPSDKQTMIVQETFPEKDFKWTKKGVPSKKDGCYVREMVYKKITCRYEKILSKADNINEVSELYKSYNDLSFDRYSYLTNRLGYETYAIAYTKGNRQYAEIFICGGDYNYIVTYSTKASVYSNYKETIDSYIVSLTLTNENA